MTAPSAAGQCPDKRQLARGSTTRTLFLILALMDSTGQRTTIDFLVPERIHDGAYGAAGLIGGADNGTLCRVESWRVAERHRPCSWKACRVSLWRHARQGRHCSTAEDTLTSEEREEISRGLAAEWSFHQIANRLGQSPLTISREVVGMEAERGIVPREPMSVLGNRVYVRKLAFWQSPSLFRSWWRRSFRTNGLPSISQGGSRLNIAMTERYVYPTRRSTRDCSSKPAAPCERS